jgi:hypothetical protein
MIVLYYISLYYTLRFYFTYLSLLAQPVNITLYGRDWTASFSILFRNGTCIIILDKKYNIMKYNTIENNIIQYNTIQYNTIQAIQCNIM